MCVLPKYPEQRRVQQLLVDHKFKKLHYLTIIIKILEFQKFAQGYLSSEKTINTVLCSKIRSWNTT
jgi:hypothetical protein